MFKIGDNVKLTRRRKLSDRFPRNIDNQTMKYGEIYKIVSFCECDCCLSNREVILNIGGYFCRESDLDLANKEIKNETDWLDVVQSNFRDGV